MHVTLSFIVLLDMFIIQILKEFPYLPLQDNDEFFELISSRFLSETRYSTSIQAAAARLLMTCSLTWIVRSHLFIF
jgi:hypothetical protein